MISRRHVLQAGLALGGAATTVSTQAASCLFPHGVASGDPGSDRMILWTRLSEAGDVSGLWRMATDPQFTQNVTTGSFVSTSARDFTVKIDVTGLKPGTDYWYRFEVKGMVSPVGRTRTLPEGPTLELNLVVACCAMYAAGHFHSYDAIARRPQLDAVLFLGDYIYEYADAAFPGVEMLRTPQPAHDTITLDDYRRRLAQTRSDPALQAAHARAAWICVWDDHEIANDDWTGGAQHHDPARDGVWAVRKAAAVKAYYEWMPIRDPDPDAPYDIKRSFSFGDLATLIVPETRLTARDEPLSLGRDLDWLTTDDGRIPDVEGFRRKLYDPQRRMVGEDQLTWMAQTMEASVAGGQPWVLLGSATVMASYNYPDLTPWLAGMANATSLKGLKQMFGLSRYELPLFNLDSWEGYAFERGRIYDMIRKTGANAVVLSGDSHMAWVNELHDKDGRVAVEVSTSTLTGPAMGPGLGLKDAPLGPLLAERNEDVLWNDDKAVGFIAISVTPEAVEARFVAISDPYQPTYTQTVQKHVKAKIASTGSIKWQDLAPSGTKEFFNDGL